MSEQRYDPTATGAHDPLSPSQQHQYGRDAAVVGGAGATGLGASDAAKHYGDHVVRGPEVHQGSNSPQSIQHQRYDSAADPQAQQQSHKGRDAAAVGAAGVAGAGAVHEHSKHDAEKAEKERLKDQKHHEKALEKERHHDHEANQKILECDAKHHQEALAAKHDHDEKEAAKQEKKEHKGGLLTFLHRDKKDKHADEPSSPTSRHSGEHAAATGAGVGTAGIGAGAFQAEKKNGRNRLHKDPPAKYAQQGTGNELHPGYGNEQSSGIVTEPHTGLPMNVGAYGDGHGGTDGNETIEGYGTHGQGQGGQVSEHQANWDNIRKANTPY